MWAWGLSASLMNKWSHYVQINVKALVFSINNTRQVSVVAKHVLICSPLQKTTALINSHFKLNNRHSFYKVTARVALLINANATLFFVLLISLRAPLNCRLTDALVKPLFLLAVYWQGKHFNSHVWCFYFGVCFSAGEPRRRYTRLSPLLLIRCHKI